MDAVSVLVSVGFPISCVPLHRGAMTTPRNRLRFQPVAGCCILVQQPQGALEGRCSIQLSYGRVRGYVTEASGFLNDVGGSTSNRFEIRQHEPGEHAVQFLHMLRQVVVRVLMPYVALTLGFLLIDLVELPGERLLGPCHRHAIDSRCPEG